MVQVSLKRWWVWVGGVAALLLLSCSLLIVRGLTCSRDESPEAAADLPPVPKELDVWKPYGIDVRGTWNLEESLPRVKVGHRSGDRLVRYYVEGAVPAIAGCELKYLAVQKDTRRLENVRVYVGDLPQDDEQARRVFRAYRLEIARQLRNERRPDGPYNDGWNSLEHKAWRIEHNGDCYWFRLDLYRNEDDKRYYLSLDVCNASI